MSKENNTFCRLYLKEVMKQVREHVPVKVRKSAWAFTISNRDAEFQVPKCKLFPQGVYWFGQVSNLWEARSKGWELALRMLGVEDKGED